jgi:hypothetical protein
VAKAIEIEDIEAHLAALEQSAAAEKGRCKMRSALLSRLHRLESGSARAVKSLKVVFGKIQRLPADYAETATSWSRSRSRPAECGCPAPPVEGTALNERLSASWRAFRSYRYLG